MKKFLPLTLVLFAIVTKAKADCNPAFTATVQGATVQLQATNTTPQLLHRWHISNGALFYGSTSTYTFYTPGTYTITHRVVDSLGSCEDSVQQIVTVDFQVSCNANFYAVADTFQSNTYHFYSTSTYSGGASSIYSYQWKIDGIVTGYSSSLISSLIPGVHQVCLTINTTGGCTSSTCQPINVSVPPPCNLAGSFTATVSPSNPKQFQFAASPGGDTIRYYWNFGDGYNAYQQNPPHTYSQAGTYAVRLVVQDTIRGCLDTVVQDILAHGLPSDSCTASFTYTANPSHPNQISFTAVSNQTITSQQWWINQWSNSYDSIFITTNNPLYTFTDTGYYWVCLYITTSTGCVKSYCNGIYIDSIGSLPGGRIPSYPNPATSDVNLRLKLEQPGKISITVYNLQGYAIYKTERSVHSGTNSITIPTGSLQAGQYFIDIQYGDQRKRSTFQKF